MIGQTLGPYAVLAKIGAGGMGEVYRARDTRLDRTVAIKVLPATLAADPQFRERFQREARVISQLTHPHICTLYDVGEDAGRAYLVMELLEGETLADRLARGRPDRPALSVAEALIVATQVAEALHAAHRKGIVHRDLKPGNVMLTPSGAKLLDFGLAKAVPALVTGLTVDTATAAGASETTNIRDRPITAHGTIVGTFHYMAPEQIEGREVDARTDVFAFGGVLYEMVTGRRAFVGDTPASVIAAILEREPTPVRDAQPLSPPLLDELVRRCLAKRPDDRWQSMADLASSLRWLSQSASGALSPAAGVAPGKVTPRASARWQLVATSVGALMVGALLASSVRWTSPRPAPRVTRTTIGSADAEPSIDGTDRDIAITHDGTRVVYIGNQGTQIFVRALDSLEARAVVTLSTYARGVFISPDDQWIGYYEGASSLSKVAMSGGPSTTILPLAIASRGATWATADTIVFAGLEPAVGLQSISPSGGVPRVLTRPDRSAGEADHVWPQMLPGGRHVLFTVTATQGGLDSAQVAVLDLESGSWKTLLRGGYSAAYAPSGHLVYVAGSDVFAVPFDLRALEVRGSPVRVLSRVVVTAAGAADFSIAQDGTLVYLDGPATSASRTLVWVDRSGRETPMSVAARPLQYPRVSPDGRRVAVVAQDQDYDLWVWDIARESLERVTTEPGQDSYPLWMPNGRQVIFGSARAAVVNPYMQAADGSGQVTRLFESPNPINPTGLTPDGSTLLYSEQSPQRGYDIRHVRIGEPSSASSLIETDAMERNAVVSPDGRFVAFESAASGQVEVYVRPYPDVAAGQWKVSIDGGRQPLWSPRGSELFYLGPRFSMMSVVADTSGSPPRIGTPKPLFTGRYYTGATNRAYDVSPDGQRFIMVKTAEGPAVQLVVVQNWIEELKRLAPAP